MGDGSNRCQSRNAESGIDRCARGRLAAARCSASDDHGKLIAHLKLQIEETQLADIMAARARRQRRGY